MIKLMDLLEEKYPKGKYIPLDAKEKKEAQQNLYDLISNAYSNIGGHVKFQSPSDIVDPEFDFWRAADLDDDPELDVVYFGKHANMGVKFSGIGHDGKRENVKNLLIRASDQFKKPGSYIEVSGDAFNSFVGRGGVPTIDDEATVRAILKGKDIEWHGEHPTGKHEGNGWYTRTIAGQPLTKTLAGNV